MSILSLNTSMTEVHILHVSLKPHGCTDLPYYSISIWRMSRISEGLHAIEHSKVRLVTPNIGTHYEKKEDGGLQPPTSTSRLLSLQSLGTSGKCTSTNRSHSNYPHWRWPCRSRIIWCNCSLTLWQPIEGEHDHWHWVVGAVFLFIFLM